MKTKTIAIRVDPDLYKWLKAQALMDHRPVGTWVYVKLKELSHHPANIEDKTPLS